MRSLRKLVLLTVLYVSSLIDSEPFVLPFLASLGIVNQDILILSDKTLSLVSI